MFIPDGVIILLVNSNILHFSSFALQQGRNLAQSTGGVESFCPEKERDLH